MDMPPEMDLETFCPVSSDLDTHEIDGDLWIQWSDQLRADLEITWDHKLYLPQADWDGSSHNAQEGKSDGKYISEAGFYKLVFASEAPAARKFKEWVLDELLLQWHQETAEPEYLYRSHWIKTGTGEAALSVVIVATSILPASRKIPYTD